MIVQRLCLIFAIMLLSATIAQATNYTFPGNLPAGCSGSSGTYTCSALTLGSSDSIAIAAPLPATITVNGNLSINTTPINAAGTAANLNLIVTGTLSAANLSSPLKINANITAGSINDQSGYLALGGSLSTTTGSITLGYQTNVTGAITSTSGAITTGQSGVIGGAISSTTVISASVMPLKSVASQLEGPLASRKAAPLPAVRHPADHRQASLLAIKQRSTASVADRVAVPVA